MLSTLLLVLILSTSALASGDSYEDWDMFFRNADHDALWNSICDVGNPLNHNSFAQVTCPMGTGTAEGNTPAEPTRAPHTLVHSQTLSAQSNQASSAVHSNHLPVAHNALDVHFAAGLTAASSQTRIERARSLKQRRYELHKAACAKALEEGRDKDAKEMAQRELRRQTQSRYVARKKQKAAETNMATGTHHPSSSSKTAAAHRRQPLQ
jgi:hypothetical protein